MTATLTILAALAAGVAGWQASQAFRVEPLQERLDGCRRRLARTRAERDASETFGQDALHVLGRMRDNSAARAEHCRYLRRQLIAERIRRAEAEQSAGRAWRQVEALQEERAFVPITPLRGAS